jgi:hypothetical protein
MDVLHKMATDQGQKQFGSFLRGQGTLTQAAQGMEFFAPEMHIFAQVHETLNWSGSLPPDNASKDSWVVRSSLELDGRSVEEGDGLRIVAPVLEDPLGAIWTRHDERKCKWIIWTGNKRMRRMTASEGQLTLELAKPLVDRNRIVILRNGEVWNGESVEGGTQWDVVGINHFDDYNSLFRCHAHQWKQKDDQPEVFPREPWLDPSKPARYVKFQNRMRHIPAGHEPPDWPRLSRIELQLSGCEIVCKGPEPGGLPDPMAELRPRFGKCNREPRDDRSCRIFLRRETV